jgi:ribosomal protein S18 acetylase RimI-like enzyme
MIIEIVEEPISVLPEYESVPIAFQVLSRFRVEPVENGLGGLHFVEERVEPYIKDYDAIGAGGERPSDWPKRWDVSNWSVLSAFADKRRVGGAVIAGKTEGLNMLADREDQCVIWDLRVHPDFRRSGIGYKLFARAADWARERGRRGLIVETQNINVPACRFYARQGCQLAAVNRYAYKDLDEVQLIWHKAL